PILHTHDNPNLPKKPADHGSLRSTPVSLGQPAEPFSSLTLTVPADIGPAETPAARYSRSTQVTDGEGKAIADGSGNPLTLALVDAAGNVVAPIDTEAGDGIGPRVTSAAFGGPAAIRVTLDERASAATAPASAWTVREAADHSTTLAVSDVTHHRLGSAFELTVAAATDGTEYEVVAPPGLADLAGPPRGPNAVNPDAASARATYTATPFSAQTQSATVTLVSLGADHNGDLRARDWSITDDGGEARAISSIEARNAAGDPLATATAASGATAAADASITAARTLAISHAALSSTASTPSVRYSITTADITAGAAAISPSGGGPTIATAPANLGGIPGRASPQVEASDGAPPTFTLSHGGPRFAEMLTATFSEPVYLLPGKEAPLAGDWVAGPAQTRLISAADPRAGTVTWAPAPPTHAVPATSTTIPIVPPQAGLLGFLIDLSPPADAPQRAGALVDAVGLDLAAAGPAGADTEAPRLLGARLVSAGEVRALFSEDVRLAPGAFDASRWHLLGSTITSARAVADEIALEVSGRGTSTAVAPGTTLEYRGGAVIDRSSNANAAAARIVPITDAAPPVPVSARALSETAVAIALSEPVHGATYPAEWAAGAGRAASVSAAGAEERSGGSIAIPASVPATSLTLTLAAGDALDGYAGRHFAHAGAGGEGTYGGTYRAYTPAEAPAAPGGGGAAGGAVPRG
ncbi:MAG: hypothetical protein OXD41_03725, partial [Thaumarchaeota archaeon]|nr:hypothetical protein [Nitrososphaerota archaeon]